MSNQSYWDAAATDPDVDEKYIANIELAPCLEALKPALHGGSILEIGSGVGRLSIPVSPQAKQLVGVDISPKMREIATARAKKAVAANCKFVSPEQFEKLPSESFDSAYSMVTFQHIGPRVVQMYINEVARLLKPGGVFRFQFVEGTHHSPQDHNYDTMEVVEWLRAAGFEGQVQRGIIFPQWTWITATKGVPNG